MSDFVNTVDGIGDEALTTSIIDRSITEILDNYVTSIGDNAFYNCSALTTADFPAVTSIGNSAFYSCSALTTAGIPAATSIGGYAFRYCSNMTTVDFPAATSIGNSAFRDCSKLTTVNFPMATNIGSSVFSSCSALTTANLPAATSLSDSMFSGCSELTTVDSPAAISIGNYAFSSCSALTTADFPVVTRLGMYAFNGCSALMTANFPAVTRIGTGAFQSCSKLTTVDFPVATNIDPYAFDDCSKLTTAGIPAATSIGNYAFSSCSKLTAADFPAVTSIGMYAFSGCSALTTANFPVATSIGDSAFGGCTKLTTVDFPAVTKIGKNAFYKCSALTTLILRSATMAALSNTNAFSSTPIESGTGYIYVPAALVDSYKAASNWSTYVNQIRAIEDYPEICEPYTWGAVAKHIELGDYATFYKVGDCVPLDLGSEGVVNMQIAAFDADDLADGSGKAPISWVAVNLCPTTHRMNPSIVDNGDGTYEEGTGMIGGWEKCELRAYLQNTIKPMIPVDVAAMIKTVSKTQTAYRPSGTHFTQTTSDEVWIPNNTELGTGKIYPNVSLKKSYTGAVFDQYWWTRSCASEKLGYCYTNSGKGKGYDPTNDFYICLGFCT